MTTPVSFSTISFFFWQMNNERVEELFELRHLLEKAALERIMCQTSPALFDELEQINKEMSESPNPRKFTELVINFHRSLMKATSNKLFIELNDSIIQFFFQCPIPDGRKHTSKKTVSQHKQLLAAMKAKKERACSAAPQRIPSFIQRSSIVKVERLLLHTSLWIQE